jgi:sigma-B regulation protein RsbU (phosphoserine phosphatase)
MKAQLISQVPLFASLPAAELAELAASLSELPVPAGAQLFREGEPGDRFYIILAGRIAIIKALGTPDEQRLALRQRGEFIGEMSLLNPDGLRMATAIAQDDAQVLELSRADFDALLIRYPQLGYAMVRELSLRLSISHNDALRDLHQKNAQLSEAYARLSKAYSDLQAAQAQLIAMRELERELQMAREIQQSLLPRTCPQLAGFDFSARMIPAHEVGGDFYDFIPFDGERAGIVIGDVAGKGMPAAIFMSLTRSLLRAEARRATSPAEALQNVNRNLLDLSDARMLVTMVYGILHAPTRTFTYARAGHEQPLVCDHSGQRVKLAQGHGLALGFFPTVICDEQTLTLPPNGALLLYTDGITDALDARDTRFGLEGLQAVVQRQYPAEASTLCEQILYAAQTHAETTPQYDDMTLVIARAP